MSGTFDPYHVWLGIPPAEQPPNHYRLLGIAVFETDLDVIDHAADRQMAHVRTFQAGRNGPLSQQLLNELSTARLCLLNPAKKVVYDGDLRSKLGAAPRAMPVAPAAAVPKAQPVAKAIPHAVPISPSASGISASASGISRSAISPSASGISPRASGISPGASGISPSASGISPRASVISPSASGISPSASGISPSASGISRTAPAIPRNDAAARTTATQTIPALASRSAASALPLEIDNEAMDALTSSPDFQIRTRRRSSTATQAWKRPVALGVMAGVVVVCFFLLYLLIKNLVSSDEWKRFILGETSAGIAAPVEPMPIPQHDAAPPPSPETVE